MIEYWFGIICGLSMAYTSAMVLFAEEKGFYKGVVVPDWAAWLILPFGCVLTMLCLLRIIKGKPETKLVDDKELAQAKAKLEAMYRREHGKAPKYPEEESEQ